MRRGLESLLIVLMVLSSLVAPAYSTVALPGSCPFSAPFMPH
jgi:hypothetical protein